MVWYEQLGFKENPLDARPNPLLIGLEKEEEQLINHIFKEEICFLNGHTGSGKTSLLQKIQDKLKYHKFIYLDADDLPKDFNLEEELKKKRNFFDKITFKKLPAKRPVLLIDEFQATDPSLILEARGKWENRARAIKSIIIAQIDRTLKNVSGSFKERLGQRIITLEILDNKSLKEILKLRLYNKKTKINFIDKFTDDALSLLVKCSDHNPRRLLEYADMIFDFHYTKFKKLNPVWKGKDYMISAYVIHDILYDKGIMVEDFEKKDLRMKSKPLKERFTKKEQEILELIASLDVATSYEISKMLGINQRSLVGFICSLKKKRALTTTGKKGRYKLWELTPGIKRSIIKK